MQRRLRVTLVATAAAGAVALGTGTAYAEGIFKSPADKNCSRSVDKDKPEKETDFPSYLEEDAESNVNRDDLRQADNGQVYYTHNKFCDGPRPWRGWDWHDKSYDTFHNKKNRDGVPLQDNDKNTYDDWDGYNSSFRKDKEKHLEPDHIGAKKNPKYATE